ncbi:nitroreductase family deazaflavin-dependent oxidoreductase [Pseudonocardia sp.]|jgi:deazaflavin-dependent oxidoreductase (nitroreductase family)|uniref:nitroreductase family deazaflavin-dependent oxidoreductase n=1 Tax=Pseudonocardia sp. TaxID=60912 RepID=UPI002631B1BB|nr:nitroreductase family deazaflavin-dependent oxidoreductase [Pseudonocardia sp.]MCW2721413.1 hypothetical protein [Pseudonocardia sp.]MDT7614285.1 hypothetical protein [Pseudonocardiales bacterium]
MVLSRRVARFNRAVTNRTIGRVAPWVPGFGVIHHRGRTTGREYRTPVNVFRTPGGYVVALTYGPGADWVRNVVAAGGCDLTTHGRVVHLTAPCVRTDRTRGDVPRPVRTVLTLIGADEFLVLSTSGPAQGG